MILTILIKQYIGRGKNAFTVKAIEENEPNLLCGATAADEKVSI